MHPFSREAMEKPFRTLQAAWILRENAETIGRVAAGASEDEIIVAVVHKDLSFGGAWAVARNELAKEVMVTEDKGGLSLIFSSNTPVVTIEERCNELARIARKRWEVMQRWVSRHPQSDLE